MSQQQDVPTSDIDSGGASVDKKDDVPKQFKKGPRFWIILVVISLTSLLTALEGTITSTVLPSIIADLGGGSNYIWVTNGYFLTMAGFQPGYGQIANVFGRRWPLIVATAAFVVGSGICGGATNMAMLISGRILTGIGGSGVSVLVEIIVCDLVPLRERGNYMALVFGMVAVGTALGPLFGGLIVNYSTWRWAFYMALPIGIPAMALLVAFLHVNYDKSNTLATKLRNLDWLGNIIFMGGSSSILIALSWAGGVYPWSSFHVIVPLVVGVLALAGFILLEGSRFIVNPMTPLHLFSNQISAFTFALTFLHGLATMWAFYFLPVYFQGVLGASAYRSGIMLLPTILIMMPFGIIGGLLLTKLGRYKPLLVTASALMVIGFGLFTLLDQNSSTGAWVGFQMIESAGAGMSIPTLLPALLAPLTDKDTALATGTWAFMRTFGLTWGVAIAGAVYSNRAEQLARSGAITNATVAAEFVKGQAYEDATAKYLNSLSPETRAQVVAVQSRSLQRQWQVAIGFAAVGFLVAAFIKEVPLRQELETEYGMTEKENKEDQVATP